METATLKTIKKWKKNTKKNTPKNRSWNIKKNFHKSIEKRAEKVSQFCDYIKLQINYDFIKDCKALYKINNTNSHWINMDKEYKDIDQIMIRKVVSSKQYDQYEIECIIDDLWQIPIARLKIKMGGGGAINTDDSNKWVLHIYWSFYRLQETQRIDYDIFETIWLQNIKDQIIIRYDYRIDYFGLDSIPKAKEIYKITKWNRTFFNWYDKQKATGLQIGQTKSWKSRQCFIRCYDKKLDILDKNKMAMYQDYLSYEKDIYRLEFEFWDKFCKARGNITLWEINKLEDQIREYFGWKKQTGLFSKSYSYEVDIQKMSDFAKHRYIKGSVSRAIKMEKAGLPLLYFMQNEWYDVKPMIQRYIASWEYENTKKLMDK